MASEDLSKDLVMARNAQRRVEHSIVDFDVSEVDMFRTATVHSDLERIWNGFVEYRELVENLKDKYHELLTPTKVSALDGQVSKLHRDAKQHASRIRERAQQINPVKPMTEFERESLQRQDLSIRMQQLVLEEQQRASQEQKVL